MRRDKIPTKYGQRKTLRQFSMWVLAPNTRKGKAEIIADFKMYGRSWGAFRWRDNKISYRTLREWMNSFGNTPKLKG